QDGLASRQRGLDQPDALDGLDAGADVIAVAGTGRKYQRVENDVLRLDAVLSREQLERTLGDLKLALARHRLRLLLVLIDAADDQRGAIAAGERHYFAEALLAVFEIDRIDQRLAGSAFERLLDHTRVGRVDYDRDFDLLDQQLEETGHIGHFVAVGILQAHVEHVGAAPHLPPSDFGRLVDFALADQPLELAAAEHVGPFADHNRPRVLVDDQRFDSRNDRAAQRRRHAR